MSEKFLVVHELQEKEIKHYCFEKCGKIIIGAMHDDQFSYGFCNVRECPYEDKLAENYGFDDENNCKLHLRKLKPIE